MKSIQKSPISEDDEEQAEMGDSLAIWVSDVSVHGPAAARYYQRPRGYGCIEL